MNPAAAKRLRLLASVLSVLLLLALLLVGWFYWRMRASLPQLDGTAAVAGLSNAVRVERDGLGVPTIRGETRADVARGLGWLHAQERFFQMDLLRRTAAGELAELFGKRVLSRDRAMRLHGFRRLAEQVVTGLAADERALLEAYTAGVNAGLGALRARPFEYLLLGELPQRWRAEDTILISYAMTLDLQDESGRHERTLMTLRDVLGLEGLAFFSPTVLPVDAALDGSVAPLPPIPGPGMLDLRPKKASAGRSMRHPAAAQFAASGAPDDIGRAGRWEGTSDSFPFAPRDPDFVPGSNAFAVAGAHTASGAALLANDIHLDHGVPNIWYRASLEFPASTLDGKTALRKVTGVTLPGGPMIIAGSNGRIAWGFTNSYADIGDMVEVETLAGVPTWYAAPDQPGGLKIVQRKETIRVKGSGDEDVEYAWTIWGPIVGRNERGKPLAHRWLAHDPAATNLGLLALEEAADVAEAVHAAQRAGIPAQNFVVADSAGDIAWTIAGRLPKRVGYTGRLPVSWAFGDRKWDGLLPPDDVPVVTTRSGGDATGRPDLPAPGGRIWSANHRHVGGKALELIGDGDYARPYRAAQIRDRLTALPRATPADLLAVQLDDRALFLTPWHQLLMETLTPAVTEQKRGRAGLRSFAEHWEGRASIEAVSYRLVREFRIAVYQRVFGAIFASCIEADPGFSWPELQLEPALWALLRERPLHLLAPEFATWDELLVAAVDDLIGHLDNQGVNLPQANWGWQNRARIRHPFGNLVPAWISSWLNMPPDPLPGDQDMPRVQSPTHGASERMVVSPGREDEGIFHMPCGQSAHPLSPFYSAGHSAWVRGEPTPFLPGETQHVLTLTP